jgi:hypothetical protein
MKSSGNTNSNAGKLIDFSECHQLFAVHSKPGQVVIPPSPFTGKSIQVL